MVSARPLQIGFKRREEADMIVTTNFGPNVSGIKGQRD
jgi:hypothetical protein